MADSFTIKLVHIPRINPDALRFDEGDMRDVGETFKNAAKMRIAKGVNSFDQPMPKLTDKYRGEKLRRGKSGIRDLRLTGNLLGSIAVLQASPGRSVVGIKGATPNLKYRVNQRISPWWGVSPTDGAAVDAVIEKKADEKIKGIFL